MAKQARQPIIDSEIAVLNLDKSIISKVSSIIPNVINEGIKPIYVKDLIKADRNAISNLNDTTRRAIEKELAKYGLRLHMSEEAIKVYRKNPYSILQKDFYYINEKFLSDELIRRLNENGFYSLIDIIIDYNENELFTIYGFSQEDINQLIRLLIRLGLHLKMNRTEINNYINRKKNPAKQESELEEKKATTDDKSTIGRVIIELNESSKRIETLLKQIEEENNYKKLLQDIMMKYISGKITESEYTEELNNAVTEMKKRRLQYE